MPRAAGPVALGFVTVVALARVDGGFFSESWPWATVGLAAAAAIALVLRDRLEVAPAAIAVVAGFAGVAAWTHASRLWADDPALAAVEAERALVYVAGALAAAVVATRATAPQLLAGVLAAAAAVCAYSIASGPRSNGSLEGPIGYANALGILAAIGILLAVGLALLTNRPLARALLAATCVPLAGALVLTDSRGSVLALAVGVCVAIAVTPRAPLVAAGAAAAALVAAALVAGATRPDALVAGDRPAYWRVAADQFEERPLVGGGAGAFHAYWLEHRPDPATLDTPHVLDAHSLYVETLAELGVVGLVLVVAALSVPLAVGLRRRRDAVVAAALPAYAAFLVHAGLDWDWEMPAVTLAGIFCGMGVVAAGDARRRPLPAWARVVGLVVAFALLAAGFRRFV